MWYRSVIEPLYEKIKDCTQARFNYYIEQFFIRLEYGSGMNKIPLGITLGITEKIYSKYYLNSKQSVALQDFIKDLAGLALLYIKYEFDIAIWNTDLLDSDSALTRFIDEPINTIEKRVWSGLNYSLTINFKNLANALSQQSKEELKALREEIINAIQQEPSPYDQITTSPLYALLNAIEEVIEESLSINYLS